MYVSNGNYTTSIIDPKPHSTQTEGQAAQGDQDAQAAPVVQNTQAAEAVQDVQAAPVVQNTQAAEAVQDVQAAPVVQNTQAAQTEHEGDDDEDVENSDESNSDEKQVTKKSKKPKNRKKEGKREDNFVRFKTKDEEQIWVDYIKVNECFYVKRHKDFQNRVLRLSLLQKKLDETEADPEWQSKGLNGE